MWRSKVFLLWAAPSQPPPNIGEESSRTTDKSSRHVWEALAESKRRSTYLWRWGWLVVLAVLMAYVWIGRTKVPFHGDEADHLFKSQNFVIYFVEKRPQDLKVTPPVAIDSPEHIRLLTGTTSAYLTGYALWSAGVKRWLGPWYYGLDVQWNIENGRWPAERILQRGRLPMAVLAMMSVPLMFGVVRMVSPLPASPKHGGGEAFESDGRENGNFLPFRANIAAVGAAFLVATHPAWLVSSRRVMQEAALGTLSLAVVMLGMVWVWSQRNTTGKKGIVCLLLGLASGLCLAAKATGAVTVGSVFVAMGLVALRDWRQVAWIFMAGVLAMVIYVALTPAIWGAPLSRIKLAAELRAEVLRGQTEASSDAYDSKITQGTALITQPFLSDLQYYETPAFEGMVDEQIADYEKAHLEGWQMSRVMGWGWTALAGLGLVTLVQGRRNPVVLVGLMWVVGTGVALAISVPLAWQRYYLLWDLAACGLAGIGLGVVWRYGEVHLKRVLKTTYA